MSNKNDFFTLDEVEVVNEAGDSQNAFGDSFNFNEVELVTPDTAWNNFDPATRADTNSNWLNRFGEGLGKVGNALFGTTAKATAMFGGAVAEAFGSEAGRNVRMKAEEELFGSQDEDLKTRLTKTAGSIGKVATELASPLIPPVAKGGTLASRVAQSAGRGALVAGVQAGSDTAMKTGDVKEALKDTAIGATVGAMLAATPELITSGLKGLSRKIQRSVIRPTAIDLKGVKGGELNATDNFYKAIEKHDLGGNVKTVLEKSTEKLAKYRNQLKEGLQESTETIDLVKVLSDAKKEAIKNVGLGDNKSIQRVIAEIDDEILTELSKRGVKDTNLNLLQATDLKRDAYSASSFKFGSPDPDASAKETFYTTLGLKLKEAIDKVAPPAVKEANEAISEILPVYSASLRRIPIEQRNNVFSLSDSIIGAGAIVEPNFLSALVLNKLAKSGTFAEFLRNRANNLQQLTQNPVYQNLAARLAGSVVSEANPETTRTRAQSQ